MKRSANVLAGFLAGIVFSLFLIYEARIFAPMGLLNSADTEALQDLAVSRELSHAKLPDVFFIGDMSDGKLIGRLSKKYPSTTLKPFRDRPKDNCDFAPCGEADFLTINIEFPLWRIAIINIGFFNGATEITLIKVGNNWKAISERSFEI